MNLFVSSGRVPLIIQRSVCPWFVHLVCKKTSLGWSGLLFCVCIEVKEEKCLNVNMYCSIFIKTWGQGCGRMRYYCSISDTFTRPSLEMKDRLQTWKYFTTWDPGVCCFIPSGNMDFFISFPTLQWLLWDWLCCCCELFARLQVLWENVMCKYSEWWKYSWFSHSLIIDIQQTEAASTWKSIMLVAVFKGSVIVSIFYCIGYGALKRKSKSSIQYKLKKNLHVI